MGTRSLEDAALVTLRVTVDQVALSPPSSRSTSIHSTSHHHGPLRSPPPVPWTTEETLCVAAIHTSGRTLCVQACRAVRRGPLGLHTGGTGQGEAAGDWAARSELDLTCIQGTLNSRINILYFLDSLCDPVHPLAPSTSTINPYPKMLAKHLQAIVDLVVPSDKEGVLNLLATKQVSIHACTGDRCACADRCLLRKILQSWWTRRVAPPDECEVIVAALEARRHQ